MEESTEKLTPEQRVLLERFVPQLRYDSQAAFCAASVRTVTDNPTNRLMRGRTLRAASNGVPALTLEFLASATPKPGHLRFFKRFGNGFSSGPRDTEPIARLAAGTEVGTDPHDKSDKIVFGPEPVQDVWRMSSDPALSDRTYGRVVVGDNDRTVLQYWLWFYGAALKDAYTTPRIFWQLAEELDAGAWRVVQVVLGADDVPIKVILGGSLARSRAWDAAAKRGDHPKVFVAPLSQELFFEPG